MERSIDAQDCSQLIAVESAQATLCFRDFPGPRQPRSARKAEQRESSSSTDRTAFFRWLAYGTRVGGTGSLVERLLRIFASKTVWFAIFPPSLVLASGDRSREEELPSRTSVRQTASHPKIRRKRLNNRHKTRGSFAGGHRVWSRSRHARDETEIDVWTRRWHVLNEASFSYRNVARRVEIQLKLASTRAAEPEELCVGGLPFKRIEVAPIEKPELFMAGWVDASLEH